jgi:hypothetical protein
MNLKEIYKSFIGKNEVLSVFCNPNDEYSSVFGFAAQMDENHFICNEISTRGKYDGYMLRKSENIFRIDYGSYYEASLHKVFIRENVTHKEIPNNSNVFINFILFAKESGFIVSVGIRDYDSSSITGYIDNIDLKANVFTVHTITQEKEGNFDGFTVIPFDDVYRMCCDTEGDRFYQILNEIATHCVVN